MRRPVQVVAVVGVAVAAVGGAVLAQGSGEPVPMTSGEFDCVFEEGSFTCQAKTPPTTEASTTTAAPATTSTAPATTPSTVAPTTSSPSSSTTVPSSEGSFASSFDTSAELGRFTVSEWRAEGPPSGMGDGSSVVTATGALRVDTYEQNYGETTLRSNTPIDLSGSATVEFDVTLQPGDRGLNGWPVFTITERPHATLTCDNNGCDDDIAGGKTIRVEFKLNNSAPMVDGDTRANSSDPSGTMRHVKATIDGGTMRLCVAADCWTYPVADMASGYVTLGGHNHASGKYGFGDFARAEFDNLAYTPSLPAVTVAAGASGTVGAGAGYIVMNVGVDASNPAPQLTYRLNGGAPTTVPVGWRLGHSRGLSIPVTFVDGVNTVTYVLSGASAGPTPKVGNVHLVSTGGAPSPPTTTVPPTSTPATSSPATSPPSTTAAPTTTASTTTQAPTTTVPAATTTTQPPSGVAFSEAFTDAESWRTRFDYGWTGEWNAGSLFGADKNDWPADHDMGCGEPNGTHRTIHLTGQAQAAQAALFACLPGGDPAKGHLMTTVNTEGYVIAWFAPKQVFTDVRKVCWDQSTSNLGGGKWAQVLFLTPAEYQGKTDLGYTSPEFPNNGGPSTPIGTARYGLRMGRNGLLEAWRNGNFGGALHGVHDDNRAPRYQHCVTDNGNGTLSATVGQPGGTVASATIAGEIPDGQIRVVFEDDNYNPDKHYDLATNDGGPLPAQPFYTWHWDNIQITS